MKHLLTKSTLLLFAFFCLSSTTFGQGPPPGPCNFTETETFCFTNNSDLLETEGNAPGDGCDYEVCVKIKPKVTCEIECEMLLDPDGYYVAQCQTLAVGNSFCFTMPTPSHPITDCFEVIITMKVISHSPTLIANFANGFPFVGATQQLSDHCIENDNYVSILKRVGTGSGTYNFKIFTRVYTGM